MNAIERSIADLFDLEISRGRRLIVEASAGTGKTWTICSMIARLVVEEKILPEQMIVVTFTRAATAEMRERIRSRLVELHGALSTPTADPDPFVVALTDRLDALGLPIEIAKNRLKGAIAGFDRTIVSTIHGLCKRLLADHAFLSGQPFHLEVADDKKPKIRAIAADFWRRRLLVSASNPAEKRFFDRLLSPLIAGKASLAVSAITPDQLVSSFSNFLHRPELTVETESTLDWDEAVAEFLDAFAEARRCWQTHRDTIVGLLIDKFGGRMRKKGTRENPTKYGPATIENLIATADDFFASPDAPASPPALLTRLGLESIATEWESTDPISHADWWRLFDRLSQTDRSLEPAFTERLFALQADFFVEAKEALELNRREGGPLSQDDLLILTRSALQRSFDLAETLRKRYPVLIVDESQDMDPVQADIFDLLAENDQSLYVTVGDPKQAIYGFRGGDIFTYLKTSQQQDAQRHGLTVNFRSTPKLVTAVNAIFSGVDAFAQPGIDFTESAAVDPAGRWIVDEDPLDGLSLTLLEVEENPDPKKNVKPTKGFLLEQAAEITADEIAALLEASSGGRARFFPTDISKSPLSLEGAHIAVLTRSKKEAKAVQQALSRRKISSIVSIDESVLESDEATALLSLLEAMRRPNRSRTLVALSTDFFGLTAADIHRFGVDDALSSRWLERFLRYHRIWRRQGVVSALSTCFVEAEAYRHLMALPDAERRLTNTRHLIEWLQRQETGRQSLDAFHRRVVEKIAEARQGLETDRTETELRLESEENLVTIMTVHKAKGLQFDIVFCPFLWCGKPPRKDDAKARLTPIVYHEGFDLKIDLGTANRPAAIDAQDREDLAEEIRVAYVALTRAKYHCRVIDTPSHQERPRSPLGWLLNRPDQPDDASNQWKTLSERTDFAIACRSRRVALSDDLSEEVDDESPSRFDREAPAFRGIVARRFPQRLLTEARQSYDFTRLNRFAHDEQVGRLDGEIQSRQASPAPDDRFALPEGANTGRCLHEIFETSIVAGQLDADEIAACLTRYGIDPFWVPAVETMIDSLLNTPLHGEAASPHGESSIRLGRIPSNRKIAEMRFRFPLRSAETEEIVSIARSFDEPILLEKACLDGAITGIVDLIVESDSRYYLVDYKTNRLGDRFEDYAVDRLDEIMTAQGYRLQYLIYLVAMHRWLSLRLPSYSYDSHVGGIFFLFTRGLSPDAPPNNGVFYRKPPAELIDRLDACFDNFQDDPS